jgi:hypothetical protein
MRLAALLCLALLAAHPAAAQDACEASVTGRPGEVIAAIDGDSKLISWVVEPREGVGAETPHFSRPGLLLDFDVKPGGDLAVSGILTTVTRISDDDRGPAPALSRVKVRARAGGAPLEWPAEQPTRGEAELVKQLRAAWPDTLALDAVVDGKVVASAEFDLSAMPAVQTMSLEALAKCDA